MIPADEAVPSVGEADLEARIQAALRAVFPSLAAENFEHQTRFRLTLGRREVIVGGEPKSKPEARSDVVVRYKGEPLLVLELKRPGQPLTKQDELQGLSYAALLLPHPPLVVVTNGADTRILESHSGNAWAPADRSEEALRRLLGAASTAAARDINRAVEVLLGSGSSLWAAALRSASRGVVADLSGDWHEPLQPFVAEFLVPRAATNQVLDALRAGQQLVLVEGPPLVGKSSVLRDLATRTETGDEFVVLLVDAQSGAGGGILRSLSNLLARELAWPVTPDEVRAWLRGLAAQDGGPALVLAIDGFGLDSGGMRAELEELASAPYSGSLRLVVALDETAADRLVEQKQQRTAIGRLAERVGVAPLNDAEFAEGARLLGTLRMGIEHGGHRSEELRLPWVLRTLAAGALRERHQLGHRGDNLITVLPPLLSIELVDLARRRFRDPALRVTVSDLARAVLRDAEDTTRSASLILAAVGTFVVRRDTLRHLMDREDINFLIDRGILRLMIGPSGEGLYVVRLPELLAAALTEQLAAGLATRVEDDAVDAADWLVSRAASLPFGDLIAAGALLEHALRTRFLPRDLIERLVNRPPARAPLAPGRYAVPVGREFEIIEISVLPDGSIVDAETGGQGLRIPAEEVQQDGGELHSDLHPWLILSHLARMPMSDAADGETSASVTAVDLSDRADAALLLEVGRCPMLLRRPWRDPGDSWVRTHTLPDGSQVVCHAEGIVEPITLSIAHFLRRGGPSLTPWIEEAVRTESVPLLMRLAITLRSLTEEADRKFAEWASRMLQDLIEPALAPSKLLH